MLWILQIVLKVWLIGASVTALIMFTWIEVPIEIYLKVIGTEFIIFIAIGLLEGTK